MNCCECRYFFQKDFPEVCEHISDSRTVIQPAFTVTMCRRFPKYEARKPEDWCGEFKEIESQALTLQNLDDFNEAVIRAIDEQHGTPPYYFGDCSKLSELDNG